MAKSEESHCELHLLQHCAPQEPIWVAERFDDLEVVVLFTGHYLPPLAIVESDAVTPNDPAHHQTQIFFCILAIA